ncbi:MAG: phosphoribosyltransferase [Flavobacteriales bacterium]|nr:MAG: phosphoribosyltransferase [Flavobacteriales bacterium]
MNTSVILNGEQIERSIRRMAWEIVERNFEETELIFAGIDGRGMELMQRLVVIINEIAPNLKVESLCIRLHKDLPWEKSVSYEPDLTDDLISKPIIVVDDVLNSGKTMLYALQPMLKKPTKRITTVALIERSHKRYPLIGDVVGLRLSTSSHEHVRVVLDKGVEKVYLE